VTYAFRNRIRIKDNKFLNIDSLEYMLSSASSSERVKITGGIVETPIKDLRDLIISGRGYDDFQSAIAAGRRWRQIASSWFARLALATDFGDDIDENCVAREFPIDLTQISEITEPIAVYHDRIGLIAVPTNPEPVFFYGSAEAIGLVTINGQTDDLLELARQRNVDRWNDELSLAYELVHASLADTNPEARFILAVTAIEALIPRKHRIPEVVAVLDGLIGHLHTQADAMDSAIADLVTKLLDSDKFESVRGFGLRLTDRLTGEYGEKTPRKYFDDIYGTRSSLAHGSLRDIPKLAIDALNQQYLELLRFVLDILEAWTPEYAADA
jgi:hypothetical protein